MQTPTKVLHGSEYRDFAAQLIAMSADEIRAAALARYPEAAAEVAAGTPVIEIYADSFGSLGKQVRLTVTPGINTSDGLIPATEPEPTTIPRFDGRRTPLQEAVSFLRKRTLATAKVEIAYSA